MKQRLWTTCPAVVLVFLAAGTANPLETGARPARTETSSTVLLEATLESATLLNTEYGRNDYPVAGSILRRESRDFADVSAKDGKTVTRTFSRVDAFSVSSLSSNQGVESEVSWGSSVVERTPIALCRDEATGLLKPKESVALHPSYEAGGLQILRELVSGMKEQEEQALPSVLLAELFCSGGVYSFRTKDGEDLQAPFTAFRTDSSATIRLLSVASLDGRSRYSLQAELSAVDRTGAGDPADRDSDRTKAQDRVTTTEYSAHLSGFLAEGPGGALALQLAGPLSFKVAWKDVTGPDSFHAKWRGSLHLRIDSR